MINIDSQRIIDRADIINTLNRFVLSVDSRDWDTMRNCLTDEVDFDYSALDTFMPRRADELIKKVLQDRSNFKAVQHLTANHQVTIDGDRAKCLANFRAQHLLAKDPNNFWTLVGRYVYNLVRTQVGWKIQGCVINVYWAETDGTLPKN